MLAAGSARLGGDAAALLSRRYEERHLHILRHPSWVSITRIEGYEYLALGRYVDGNGTRKCLRVPLHHLTCYLRWGGASSAMVCHDVPCPHRHCLSPGCLRWGDDHENVQDRVTRPLYLSTGSGVEGRRRHTQVRPSMLTFAFVSGGWVAKGELELRLGVVYRHHVCRGRLSEFSALEVGLATHFV